MQSEASIHRPSGHVAKYLSSWSPDVSRFASTLRTGILNATVRYATVFSVAGHDTWYRDDFALKHNIAISTSSPHVDVANATTPAVTKPTAVTTPPHVQGQKLPVGAHEFGQFVERPPEKLGKRYQSMNDAELGRQRHERHLVLVVLLGRRSWHGIPCQFRRVRREASYDPEEMCHLLETSMVCA